MCIQYHFHFQLSSIVSSISKWTAVSVRRIMASLNYDDYYEGLVAKLQSDFILSRVDDKKEENKILEENSELRENDAASNAGLLRSSTVAATPPLRISDAFFYPQENAKNHHTAEFQLVSKNDGVPVLRRGQSFFIALLTPSRPYDETKDAIKLVFNFGPKPSPLIGTQVNLKVEKLTKLPDSSDKSWAARISQHDKNAISIEVISSPDSHVGIWSCRVETRLKDGPAGRILTYKCPDDIYLLFNPWEPNDTTYMPDTDKLNEYILEERGKIWYGPKNHARGRHWALGQFDISVLPLVMIILEKSGLAFAARSNPILVSRALSKMINAKDDDGVVVGRWDNKYGDGVAPAAWTGSVPIIEKYFHTLKPVKYGQCWIFAGVLCTVCRAIGIPCRVVTNYISAHDANSSLTVDVYYNDQNEEYDFDPHNPSGGKDSIWNYHVWNDVWMARPDLPKGYGGWQAIDSTPQERSEGKFQCGPASLEAVRLGQVGFAYDVPFLVSEVNADLVHWKKDHSADNEFGFTRISSNNYHIGKMILTKKPNEFDDDGDQDRDDILAEYKNKEGTRSERLSLLNAVRGSTVAPKYFEIAEKPEHDVEFDLIELETVPIGESFAVEIKMKNNSAQSRNIQADLSAESVYYTGTRATSLKKASGKVTVPPGQSEEIRMTVTSQDYLTKLVEYGIVKMSAICSVDETNQNWHGEDDLQILKPQLSVQPSADWKVNRPAQLTFSFKNPLPQTLSGCTINYEGPGFTRFGTIKLRSVPASGECKYIHTVVPRSAGSQRWIATFSSAELVDIVGSVLVSVSS